MTDRISKENRSRNMAAIKSKNTKPEIYVRKILYKNKYRYRLHRSLTGKPDIILSKYKAVVFVNGCFWHNHSNCKKASIPKSNKEYWVNKFAGNLRRDRENKIILKKEGWNILTLWECEIDKKNFAEKKITEFLVK